MQRERSGPGGIRWWSCLLPGLLLIAACAPVPVAEEAEEARRTPTAWEQAVSWYRLAQSYLDQGQPRTALDPARRAVELAPTDPDFRRLLVRVLSETGRHHEALTQVTQTLALPAPDPAARQALILEEVRLRLLLDDLAGAETTLREHPIAMEDPTWIELRADLLKRQGEGEAAWLLLRNAAGTMPEEASVRLLLAHLAMDEGDLQQAERYAERAQELQERSVEAYLILARIAALKEQPGRALQALEVAATLEGETPRVLAARADFHLLRNEPFRALQATDRAIRVAPEDPTTLLLRAQALQAAGKAREADKVFEAVLRLTPPGHPVHREAARLRP